MCFVHEYYTTNMLLYTLYPVTLLKDGPATYSSACWKHGVVWEQQSAGATLGCYFGK